jgi:predicted metal-dependent hydrolase
MQQIQVDDLVVDVVRKGIKNFYVRIYPDGRVRVTSSIFTTDAFIRKYLTKKMPWIQRKLEQFAKLPKHSPIQMQAGEVHYFLGEPYRLEIRESSCTIERDEETRCLYMRPEKTSQLKEILDDWYKSELIALIPPLLEKWEKILAVKTYGWSVKKMRSRWGSCNIQKKRISLNLELVKKPISCLEYVLVHELVHLHERHHNKRFYSLMDKFLPDWRVRDKELLGR